MNDQTIILRSAAKNDLDQLLYVENTCFDSDRISRQQFRKYLTKASVWILTAEADKMLCGYAVLFFRKNSQSIRLYSIAVLSEYRQAGIGQQMLDLIYIKMSENNKKHLTLEVREDNVSAIRFYEKNGFRQFGMITKFYEDGCSALRMEKLL